MAVRLEASFNNGAAVIFLLLAFGIGAYLTFMLTTFPLFDFAMHDIVWVREWLIMTIIDYYGLAFSLGIIVLKSEPFPWGILWTLGFCLLGSPIACLYISYRFLFKSIYLMENDYYKQIRIFE
jgi:hypothetical protein